MDLPAIILTPFGIALIVIGLLQQGRGFATWNIRNFNRWRGVKTEISKQTITAQKVQGIMFIVIGIVLLAMAFVVIPSMSSSFSNS